MQSEYVTGRMVWRCYPQAFRWAPLLVAAMLFTTSCGTVSFQRMRDGVQPITPMSGDPEKQAHIYQEIGLSERQRQEAHVQIVGGDIELPPTAGADKPVEQRTYDFYVWVSAPTIFDVETALRNGELLIDVLNAKARIEEVKYGSFKGPEGAGKGGATGDLTSGNVVRVSIDSRDITQSFTLVAKLPRLATEYGNQRAIEFQRLRNEYEEMRQQCESNNLCIKKMKRNDLSDKEIADRTTIKDAYRKYIAASRKLERHMQEENPYMATRVVKVFNGDLHTQVYMLSDAETRDAFGTNFARHFYVGKAYFRNRHSDMKLIVNTTSLRAKTLFYRAPTRSDPDDGFEYSAARYRYLNDFFGPEEAPSAMLSVDQQNRVYLRVMQRQTREMKQDLDSSLANEIVNEITGDLETKKVDEEQKKKARVLADQVRTLVLDLRRAVRYVEAQCKVESASDKEGIQRAFSGSDMFPAAMAIENLAANGEKKAEKPSSEDPIACVTRQMGMQMRPIMSRSMEPSPIKLDGRRRVGLTDKVAAASQDVYWQLELNRSGYVWEDYYRPMTLEAVLISLAAKTRSHPNNRAIAYLQSIGVIAGALVGMDQISSVFGSEAFAQRVAVTTGVFMPEVRKLLMRDLDQYLANLASTALPSILSLGPNESRDGYVFFPRGPIYGYGVDEFSLEKPSYIRNVDNDDVAVDGALIEAEKQFSAGQKSAEAIVGVARSQGRAKMSEDMAKQADLEAKYFALRTRNLISEVCEMIDNNKGPAAAGYLDGLFPKSEERSETIKDLIMRAKSQIKCDQPLPAQPAKS